MARWDKRKKRPHSRAGVSPDMFAAWDRVDAVERAKAADLMQIRELARIIGARNEDEIRAALEMIVMASRAELARMAQDSS